MSSAKQMVYRLFENSSFHARGETGSRWHEASAHDERERLRSPQQNTRVTEGGRSARGPGLLDTNTASHFTAIVRKARNPALADIDLDIHQTEASRAETSARLAEMDEQIKRLDATILATAHQEATRAVLEGVVKTQETALSDLRARRTQAALMQQLAINEAGNVAFVELPTFPSADDPVVPAPFRYLLFAAVLGSLGGLTVALWSALFGDERAADRHDLAATSSRGSSRPIRVDTHSVRG